MSDDKKKSSKSAKKDDPPPAVAPPAVAGGSSAKTTSSKASSSKTSSSKKEGGSSSSSSKKEGGSSSKTSSSSKKEGGSSSKTSSSKEGGSSSKTSSSSKKEGGSSSKTSSSKDHHHHHSSSSSSKKSSSDGHHHHHSSSDGHHKKSTSSRHNPTKVSKPTGDAGNGATSTTTTTTVTTTTVTVPVAAPPAPKKLLPGPCMDAKCDCDTFIGETQGGIVGECQNCGHADKQHEMIEEEAAKEVTPAGPVDESVKEMTAVFNKWRKSAHPPPSDAWEVDPADLQFTKTLGEGTSAKVFRGTYRNQDVAIKVLKGVDEKQMIEFAKEFDIMKQLRSQRVVFFFGACKQPNLCMVLELCHKGSLYHVLSNPDEDIGWELVFSTATASVQGLRSLHDWKPPIFHRDLKSLNLLVDQNWNVKISDFGLSRFSQHDQNSTLAKLRGTYAYCAPEVYQGKPYTAKSDIYSMGVILWELAVRAITRKYAAPYSEFKHINFDFQIIIQTAKKHLRPTVPATCPQGFADLIQRCWHREVDQRPTTQELLDELKKLRAEYEAAPADWDKAILPPS